MNFDIANLFKEGFAKMTALDECENLWKKLIQNPTSSDDEFWQAASMAYDLLAPCLEDETLPKELIGIYTLLHDFAISDTAQQKAPVWAGIAEAIAGIAAYSIVEIPIENARSVRAFCGDKEYIANLDKKEITEE
ncbi:MAG: hypothetical protein IKV36_01730 [Clostridia bacterium]|nr:hypothetical protein [Clostridia bacterium]